MSTSNKNRFNGKSPVYRIDFTAVACGSRIASTKRKIRWRFGFTNKEALEAGMQGAECRGEEHEISLTWSIASGKRVVHVDRQEINYSNSRSGTFEFSWTMRGNHVLKIVAHASPPLSVPPGFRQYDFFVDGQSFFSFPKVYMINLSNRDAATKYPPSDKLPMAEYKKRESSGGPVWKYEEPQNELEEQAIYEQAIKQSMQENTPNTEDKPAPAASGSGDGDLLDFFSAVPAAEPTPRAQHSSRHISGAASVHSQDSKISISAQTWAHPAQSSKTPANPFVSPAASLTQQRASSDAYAYGLQPTPSYDTRVSTQTDRTSYTFAKPPPAAQTTAPVAQQYNPAEAAPTRNGYQYAQPSSYQQPVTTAPDPFQAPVTAAPIVADNPFQSAQPYQPTVSAPVASEAQANGSTDPFGTSAAAPTSTESKPEFSGSVADQAYMKIAAGFSLSSNDKINDVRSNPFDTPASVDAKGPQPTLEGLQTSKPEQAKKEVMKAPAAGALVMSTNQTGNWGGVAQGYNTQGATTGYGAQQQQYNGGYNNANGWNGYAQQQQYYGGYNQQQNYSYANNGYAAAPGSYQATNPYQGQQQAYNAGYAQQQTTNQQSTNSYAYPQQAQPTQPNY